MVFLPDNRKKKIEGTIAYSKFTRKIAVQHNQAGVHSVGIGLSTSDA